MTDDGLARLHEALRQAVAAVIDAAAADEAALPPAYRSKLSVLENTLNGTASESPVGGGSAIQDPDVHMLSMRDYQRGVPGGAPLSLGDRARGIRASLAGDDAAEPPQEEWPFDHVPVLTELQAMVVATLLQELAARLTAGSDEGGAELARIALELADEVLAPTFVGAQR
jgi:hypothetical protein